jgi:hypothetical protein
MVVSRVVPTGSDVLPSTMVIERRYSPVKLSGVTAPAAPVGDAAADDAVFGVVDAVAADAIVADGGGAVATGPAEVADVVVAVSPPPGPPPPLLAMATVAPATAATVTPVAAICQGRIRRGRMRRGRADWSVSDLRCFASRSRSFV